MTEPTTRPECIRKALDELDEGRRRLLEIEPVVAAIESAIEHFVGRCQPEHRPVAVVKVVGYSPICNIEMHARGRGDVAEMLRALGIHGLRRGRMEPVVYPAGSVCDAGIWLCRAAPDDESRPIPMPLLRITFAAGGACRKVKVGERVEDEYRVVCGEG